MYEHITEGQNVGKTIGGFVQDKNLDFKNSFKAMVESFQGSYSTDAISDLSKILTIDALKENYKEQLIGDVLQESFGDTWLATHPDKLDQLFENSALEIAQESSVGPLNPIVGLSLPILKKNYLECHAKDIVMTEVPDKPIVKVSFERKFLKDKAGNKFYIPEIFYNDDYKQVYDLSKGKKISDAWYPDAGVLPVQDLNILSLSGGSLEMRDELGLDFGIEAVKIEVPAAGGGVELKVVSGLNIQPDFAAGGAFTYRVKAEGDGGVVVEDIITGLVDSYSGKISVSSTSGKIKQVRFGGHLSNQNNMETIELDREREHKEWKIPDGQRINTGLTIEKIRDFKALLNIDITAELIADMSTALTQFEDSLVLDFLDTSLNKWKGRKDLPFGYTEGFVESYQFSATPPAGSMFVTSQWIDTELKFNLNRELDSLKEKLKTNDIMFVIYGNPANITLIQNDVKWVIDEDTKIGGIQLDYSFGVMTNQKNRIHVVSSMKVPRSKGIRIVAYPVTKDVITFKHLKYSLNIENVYRNPNTPLTPNIMATSRYLTKEVLPVQGEFVLTNTDFGRQAL